MKNYLRHSLLLLSIAFSSTSQAQSDPVWVNGINYELNEETKTASVTYGGDYVGDIVIPSSVNGYSVTSIGDYAFTGCDGLISVTIPSSVTSIGERPFGDCVALTSVTIPNSVISIGAFAFNGCTALTSLTLPNTITSLERNLFMGCTLLTSIEIPDAVTSIGPAAFSGCSALTSITLPEAVTSIGRWAFEGCSALTTVVCEAVSLPTCDENVFAHVPTESATLYVPAVSVGAYSSTEPWNSFGSILAINDIGTKIQGVACKTNNGASTSSLYNIGGQRISKPGRGIFIKNGNVFIAK